MPRFETASLSDRGRPHRGAARGRKRTRGRRRLVRRLRIVDPSGSGQRPHPFAWRAGPRRLSRTTRCSRHSCPAPPGSTPSAAPKIWRLCAQLSAVELIRKGCTACFDLFIELPGPTVEGIHAVARAYQDVGLRAVVAPMIADRTLYQALPGLLDAFRARLFAAAVAALSRSPTGRRPWQSATAAKDWPVPMDRVRPGLGPTIPLHCC